jgi:hypothetical protein
MNRNNTRRDTNKNICNGFECLCEATNYVDEEVGDMGKILLQLCNDCLAKFREY